jgi:DNA replication protein DnaC
MISEGQPTPLRERVRQAAEAARRRAEEERGNPGLAAQRKAQREALAASEKAAHEARQWARMGEALEDCGLQAGEVAALRRGLSGDWEALREVRAWLKGPEAHLLLLGAPGTGKTLAGAEAVASCRFWYMHPDWGRTWAWPEALGDCGLYVLSGDVATLSYYGKDTETWRRKLCGCRLLVVDELGTEVMSAGWQSLLDTIFNQRHRAQRKTLLLSNLDAADFKARYGARLARRVREEGRAVSLGAVTLSGGGK